MLRSCLIAAVLALPVTLAADPAPHLGVKHAGAAKKECCAKCPMCAAMSKHTEAKGASKPTKMAGMSDGMGGMMGSKTATPSTAISVTFAPDGTVYVVRGDTIYKLDGNLAIAAQVRLGVVPEPAASAAGANEHNAHKH